MLHLKHWHTVITVSPHKSLELKETLPTDSFSFFLCDHCICHTSSTLSRSASWNRTRKRKKKITFQKRFKISLYSCSPTPLANIPSEWCESQNILDHLNYRKVMPPFWCILHHSQRRQASQCHRRFCTTSSPRTHLRYVTFPDTSGWCNSGESESSAQRSSTHHPWVQHAAWRVLSQNQTVSTG